MLLPDPYEVVPWELGKNLGSRIVFQHVTYRWPKDANVATASGTAGFILRPTWLKLSESALTRAQQIKIEE